MSLSNPSRRLSSCAETDTLFTPRYRDHPGYGPILKSYRYFAVWPLTLPGDTVNWAEIAGKSVEINHSAIAEVIHIIESCRIHETNNNYD